MQDTLVAKGATIRWDNEPFDGEEVFAVAVITETRTHWDIYLSDTQGWVGYAFRQTLPSLEPG